MTRYIDADALIKKLFPYDVVNKKDYSINAKAVADAIANMPTADVVPKSEVEELSGKYEDLKLKYADLQKDKDELIAWGGHITSAEKADVAREIFEDIQTALEYEYMSYLKAYDYTLLTKIEELKKKYTGENDNES